MPREGAIIFDDLIGKLDVLYAAPNAVGLVAIACSVLIDMRRTDTLKACAALPYMSKSRIADGS